MTHPAAGQHSLLAQQANGLFVPPSSTGHDQSFCRGRGPSPAQFPALRQFTAACRAQVAQLSDDLAASRSSQEELKQQLEEAAAQARRASELQAQLEAARRPAAAAQVCAALVGLWGICPQAASNLTCNMHI